MHCISPTEGAALLQAGTDFSFFARTSATPHSSGAALGSCRASSATPELRRGPGGAVPLGSGGRLSRGLPRA